MEIQIASGTCRVCGVSNALGATQRCPACDTPHHQECWQYAGRCSTYGCGYSALPVLAGDVHEVGYPEIRWSRQSAFMIVIRVPLWAFYITLLLGSAQMGVLIFVNGLQNYMVAMFSCLVLLAAMTAVASVPLGVLVYCSARVLKFYAEDDDTGIVDLHQLQEYRENRLE